MQGSLLPCRAVGGGLAGTGHQHLLDLQALQAGMGLDSSCSTSCHPWSPEELLCHLERSWHFLERVSNSASSKASASPLNSAPYTEKSCPQIPFTCLFLSFFPIFFNCIFSLPFFIFWRGRSRCREAAVAAAALQTCLQPESHTRNGKGALTSGMLNRILPRETSRNHTLLWTHIHSLPLLSLLFPWILWQKGTPRFLERGLCTLATFPAGLAGKKSLKCWRLPYCAYGNSYTPGNPS